MSTKKILNAIEHNLDDLHWSEQEGCYCDATINDFEENKLVCHKGYISLFPFLTGLLKPDSPKLGKILTLLGDEEELFSPYGLRSLSRKDELYGTNENYWRSPIWININYLAIVELYVCCRLPSPPPPPRLPSPTVTPSPAISQYQLLCGFMLTLRLRKLRLKTVRTRRRQRICTHGCARTWSRRCTTHGRRRASHGSSTTPRQARASARSISLAGPVWWSRSWLWKIWVEPAPDTPKDEL